MVAAFLNNTEQQNSGFLSDLKVVNVSMKKLRIKRTMVAHEPSLLAETLTCKFYKNVQRYSMWVSHSYLGKFSYCYTVKPLHIKTTSL